MLVGQLKHSLTKLSTAVRTVAFPEVEEVVNKIRPDLHGVKKYSTDIISWLKPVIDLSGYHVYPMNGITEGLNWWSSQNADAGIQVIPGDYQWITARNGDPTWQYISIPSAIDGNWKSVPKHHPIALDLAYVGSTKIHRIEHDADVAFFSLSKSFGLRNIRTGWYFTKTPDSRLEDLCYGAKYYNYYAAEVAESIINQFDIDYVYNKLLPQQLNICKLLNFTPSNSVWLATTDSEEFAHWRRGSTQARICLAGLYHYEKT